jgi:hypothetical protein
MDPRRLHELYDVARRVWPEVALPLAAFASHLSARLPAGEAHASDLYLACACARSDASALAHQSRCCRKIAGSLFLSWYNARQWIGPFAVADSPRSYFSA